MKNFLPKQNNNSSDNYNDSTAFLSPNLAEASIEALSKSKKNNAIGIVFLLLTFFVLGVFFVTLFFNSIQTKKYQDLTNKLNEEAFDIELFKEAQNRFTNLQKRIDLHKQTAPQREELVNNIAESLSIIKADENLSTFKYQDNKLVVTFEQDEVLNATLKISELVKQKNVKEISILGANLNSSDNTYTIILEISYK